MTWGKPSVYDCPATGMALDMREAARGFSRPEGTPLELRIGINTGPVVAGVIGTKKFIYDLWGDTVNLASRMESHGAPGLIQVTEDAYQELTRTAGEGGGEFRFGPRREIEVKGRGNMAVYELIG